MTYSDLFNVLPFGNIVMVKTLTGDAIARMLEQQTPNRVLQVSSTFATRGIQRSRPGSRVNRSTQIDGKPILTDRAIPGRHQRLRLEWRR